MRSRDAALRSKRFEAEEKSRKVQGLGQMIREFEQIALDLERQVEAEVARTGIKDRNHFAYSMLAKSVSLRREKLLASINDLQLKLDDAMRDRDEALAELAASLPAELREMDRSRQRTDRPAAASLR